MLANGVVWLCMRALLARRTLPRVLAASRTCAHAAVIGERILDSKVGTGHSDKRKPQEEV
jgi:hypothetical protein